MPRLVAFIRGINVTGRNKLAMSDLRAICESAGLTNVKTYLQSGNVVFDGDPATLERAIGHKIVLRTSAQMRAIVKANPFKAEAQETPSYTFVIFLEEKPSAEAVTALMAAKVGPEKAEVLGRELYAFYPNGMGQSKFTHTLIERKLRVTATARNFNTVNAILEMM